MFCLKTNNEAIKKLFHCKKKKQNIKVIKKDIKIKIIYILQEIATKLIDIIIFQQTQQLIDFFIYRRYTTKTIFLFYVFYQ